MQEIAAFATYGPQQILVLPGPAGIGKTRLLREVAESHEAAYPDRAVRLHNDGVPITVAALDEMPPLPCLVIVDDAHRRTDLGPLLAWLRQRRDSRLILSARLLGVEKLMSELIRAGFDTTQIRRLEPLVELKEAEALELASQALGPEHDQWADILAAHTRDSPFATMVGGRLLALRSIPPGILERNADFRQELLPRFQDELLGRINDQISPDLCRRLLELLAALTPMDERTKWAPARLATFLLADPVEVTKALEELEHVGLLVCRGQSLELCPDVLADHILACACLTRQGNVTGFADRVFEAFADDALAPLLRNLAEVDWRVRETAETGTARTRPDLASRFRIFPRQRESGTERISQLDWMVCRVHSGPGSSFGGVCVLQPSFTPARDAWHRFGLRHPRYGAWDAPVVASTIGQYDKHAPGMP